MSMDDRDNPDGASPQKEPRDKKTQNSFLALGLVFLGVGIGMSFGDSSVWIAFLAIGITFVGVAATSMAKNRGTTPKGSPTD